MGGADEWMKPLLAGKVCFDATVPRHLVSADLGGCLQPFSDRACWPAAVEAELGRAKFPKRSTIVGGRFAGVIELSQAQSDEAEDLRLESLTRAEIRTKLSKNLGEAECVILCQSTGMPLVVHDEQGREWARRRGIRIFTVIDVLCVAVRFGLLKPAAAWRAYLAMCTGAHAMIPLAAYPPGVPGHRPFMNKAEPLYSQFVAEGPPP